MGTNLLHQFQSTVAEGGTSGTPGGLVGPNEWNAGHQLYLDVNAQTGTSYTIAAGDDGALVTFNNVSAVAVTLPQAQAGAASIGSALGFYKGWFCFVSDKGAGAVTITPTTSTINGAASLTLYKGQTVIIVSDGTNYQVCAVTLPLGSFVPTSGNIVVADGSQFASVSLTGDGILNSGGVLLVAGGFRNKFRNASFDIAQRGVSGSTSSSAGVYTLDGWIVGSDGTHSVSWSQQYGSGPAGSSLQIVGATGVTDTFVKQRIESYVAAALASKTVTVQFLINPNGANLTPTLTVKHPSVQDNWGSTITTDVSAVSLQTVNNGSLAAVAYTFSCPANAAYGLEVTLDFGSSLNAASKSVIVLQADIRSTPGLSTGLNSNPPPIETRPVGIEYPGNLRYLFVTSGNGYIFRAHPQSATSGTEYNWAQFPTPMRAVPAISGLTSAAGQFNTSSLATANVTCLGSRSCIRLPAPPPSVS